MQPTLIYLKLLVAFKRHHMNIQCPTPQPVLSRESNSRTRSCLIRVPCGSHKLLFVRFLQSLGESYMTCNDWGPVSGQNVVLHFTQISVQHVKVVPPLHKPRTLPWLAESN